MWNKSNYLWMGRWGHWMGWSHGYKLARRSYRNRVVLTVPEVGRVSRSGSTLGPIPHFPKTPFGCCSCRLSRGRDLPVPFRSMSRPSWCRTVASVSNRTEPADSRVVALNPPRHAHWRNFAPMTFFHNKRWPGSPRKVTLYLMAALVFLFISRN